MNDSFVAAFNKTFPRVKLVVCTCCNGNCVIRNYEFISWQLDKADEKRSSFSSIIILLPSFIGLALFNWLAFKSHYPKDLSLY